MTARRYFRARMRYALALALLAGSASAEQTANEPAAGINLQRIVKHFDFSQSGHRGEMPRDWEEFGGESFPRFAGGGLDVRVGHGAPPSVFLDSNGRSVAFRYLGTETPIRPNADYLVSGWIKPHQLSRARATITAYYLDYRGLPLRDTQRQGRLIGGGVADEWQRVEVLLPAGPPEAFALGLTLWVEQAAIWDADPRPARHIEWSDVRAGAWFDDLVVYRLPQVGLEAAMPGGVFTLPSTPALRLTLTDDDPRGLEGRFEVSDASGGVVERREVTVPSSGTSMKLAGLQPGWYCAKLSAHSGELALAERRLDFVVLSELDSAAAYPVQSFGIVLEPPPGGAAGTGEVEQALIAGIGVGAIKLPLWSGRLDAPGLSEHPKTLDSLVNGLLRRRVDVTGVLGGAPPEILKRVGTHARPLIDILVEPPESWRELLSATVTPYASVLTSWQVGADGDAGTTRDSRFPAALAAVRRELLELITAPYLTAPGAADVEPQGPPLPVERVTLSLPRGVRPGWIGAHLEAFKELGYLQVGAYLPRPPSGQYDRTARLADWAVQIIEARHAGADVVYVAAPWRSRLHSSGICVEPSEDYVIYRTLVSLLRDAGPDGDLTIAPGVHARLFTQGERSVAAVWDPAAPPEGRTVELQLGESAEVTDLWGRSQPLARTPEGQARLVIGPVPRFVRGIERWVAALAREIKLLPEQVTFSLGSHRHVLRMNNSSEAALPGTITLEAPPSWQVRPRQFDFAVPAGAEYTREIELKYSHNEGAGPKTVWADVHLDGAIGYRLRVPLRFELSLHEVDVWGYAIAAGEGIIVRQVVRNRSAAPVSFRAFASAPGRERQYKIIVGLAPGMTDVKEYRFAAAADLAGRSIRVSLREVNGPRMHNLDVDIP